MKIELRSVTGPDAVDVSDKGIIFGLAIPYDRVTTIGNMARGGFREKIAPGACTKSLREADIVALFNHESSMPLGRTSAGNLKLSSTKRGVEPELDPVKTSYAADLAELVRTKTIRGWSFGFEVIKDSWTDAEGRDADEWSGTDRTIREMRLIEVSPVTFPAYGDDMTNIGLRSGLLAERESRAAGTSPRDESRVDDDEAPAFMGVFEGLSPEALALIPEELREAIEDYRMKNPKKPYGDVKYADPKNGKYPIDTKKHVKAAWAYINMPKNQKFYPLNGVSLASVMAKIKQAALAFGIDISEANEADLALEWRMYLDDYQINSPETEAREKADKEARKTAKRDARKAKRSAAKASRIAAADAEIAKRLHELAGTKNPKGKRAKGDPMSGGTAKRVPQIVALLDQALALFACANVDKLPDEAQQAVALVSSACTHANHILDHEGLKLSDAISAKDAAAYTGDPPSQYSKKEPSAETRNLKPDSSTSGKLPDNDALLLAVAKARSREIELGL